MEEWKCELCGNWNNAKECIKPGCKGKPKENIIYKQLNEYSDKEKLELFEKFYEYAKEIFEYVVENGYELKDCKQWAFEMILELLGKDIWYKYNEYI